MNYPAPEHIKVFDFTEEFDPDYIRSFRWGIGKYNERRKNMYNTSLFSGDRCIHMGIDIWNRAGQSVYSFNDGEVWYKADNNQPGDYGPTLVLRYELTEQPLFALYGHLSRVSLGGLSIGEKVQKAQKIASLGTEEENGGWVPHLHFQLSIDDPGRADMPGVVSEADREEALKRYPDPRLVLGTLY